MWFYFSLIKLKESLYRKITFFSESTCISEHCVLYILGLLNMLIYNYIAWSITIKILLSDICPYTLIIARVCMLWCLDRAISPFHSFVASHRPFVVPHRPFVVSHRSSLLCSLIVPHPWCFASPFYPFVVSLICISKVRNNKTAKLGKCETTKKREYETTKVRNCIIPETAHFPL